MLIAAFPMYDWPEPRAETNAEWTRFAAALREAGIEAPAQLTRRNADLPAVPGGIRDGKGRAIAPDPATRPPDDLDLSVLWPHPNLLLAQTCWGPMEAGLADHVQVVGQPDYSAFEGGQGPLYSSAIVMRRDDVPLPATPLPPIRHAQDGGRGNAGRDAQRYRGAQVNRAERETGNGTAFDGRTPHQDIPAPADGTALIPTARLRDRCLAYNEPTSMSGFLALERDLAAMGQDLSIFAERIETGSHRASALAVAEGRADVCALDCRMWALIRRFDPAAEKLAVAGWTAWRLGLPLITSGTTSPQRLAALRRILGTFLADGGNVQP